MQNNRRRAELAVAVFLCAAAVVGCRHQTSAPPSSATYIPLPTFTPSPVPAQENVIVAPTTLTIPVGGFVRSLTALSRPDGGYALMYDTDRNTYYRYPTSSQSWETQKIEQIKSPTFYYEPLAIQHEGRLLVFQADNWYDSAGSYGGQGLEVTERSGYAWAETRSIFRNEYIGVFNAAFSSDGHVAVIWTNFTRDPSKLKLYFAEEIPGKSWSQPVLLSEGRDLVSTKLVLDENGRLNVLAFESLQRDETGWQRITSGRFVMFKRDAEGSWGLPTVLGNLSGTKAYLGQFAGSTVRMFWKDHRIQLIFGAYDVGGIGSLYDLTQAQDGTWSEPTLIATNAMGELQVWDRGDNDRKTVFWSSWDEASSTIMAARETESGWTKPAPLVGPVKDRHIRRLALAPDSDGARVLWDEGQTPISVIKVAEITPDLIVSAVAPVPTVPESAGPFVVLADGQHRANIAWTQGRGVAFARLDNDRVVELTYPVDPDGAMYTVEAAVLDEQGNMHAVSEDKPGRFSTIRYGQRQQDGNWKIEVAAVADETWYGLSHPTIAISGGEIHLLYARFSDTNAQIMYVKRGLDGTWGTPEILQSSARNAVQSWSYQFRIADGHLTLSSSIGSRVLATLPSGSWAAVGTSTIDSKPVNRFPDGNGNEYVIWSEQNALGYQDILFKVVHR